MRLHIAPTPSPRPLVRVFHAARIARASLAQVYELLLPATRRALPLPPRAAPSAPARRHRAIAK